MSKKTVCGYCGPILYHYHVAALRQHWRDWLTAGFDYHTLAELEKISLTQGIIILYIINNPPELLPAGCPLSFKIGITSSNIH